MANEAQAAEKERLAGQFDRWRHEVEGLLKSVSTDQGGEPIWTGPAANRFNQTLQPISRQIEALPAAFERTARSLRESARKLRAEG